MAATEDATLRCATSIPAPSRATDPYVRIERAIAFICEHYKSQPSLDEMARAAGLSPYHFQRMFSAWAGVSPKKFIQYLSVEYAKELLSSGTNSLLATAYDTGLSGSGRLHDLFVAIEAMTPGEFRREGAGLTVNYEFFDSPFGPLVVASTPKGVNQMFFESDQGMALQRLRQQLPRAHYRRECDAFQNSAMQIFRKDWHNPGAIKLHLAGTPYQLKVWASLLKIPAGQLASYQALAQATGNPKAARSVGNAVGANPIAVIIPCHRVIQSTGHVGGYRWGSTRKSALIGWESARCAPRSSEDTSHD